MNDVNQHPSNEMNVSHFIRLAIKSILLFFSSANKSCFDLFVLQIKGKKKRKRGQRVAFYAPAPNATRKPQIWFLRG